MLFLTQRKKRRLININYRSRFYSEEYRSSPMGLNVDTFCRCEIKCEFKGKGEVRGIELMKKCQRYICPLVQLRNKLDVSRSTLTS